MQNGVFTGLFVALSTEFRMNNIANNLANANTTAYKEDRLAFRDTMIQFAHDQIREPLTTVRSDPLFPEPKNMARVRIAESKTDHRQGGMEYTGSSLDVAISGDGFFQIQTPNGTAYTRDGAFTVQADGTLVTKRGMPVLGGGGPIVLPAGSTNIHISHDGAVLSGGVAVANLDVMTFDQLEAIEKIGGNLYRVREGYNPAITDALAGGALVNQGFLEASNINVVEEMVNMIEVHRMFDAAQKVMQTSNELDSQAYEKLGASLR